MIEFRQKDFSFLSSMSAGAGIGATIGGLVGKAGSYNNSPQQQKGMLVGLVAGAALGALAGALDEVRKRFNRKRTVDRRLMSTVVDNLIKAGLEEGKDFTRDPKVASSLKTKVCICISKVSGDLRILVNMVSDPKLKSLADELVKNLPNKSVVNEKISDRFNDIIISTISDSSMDAGLVTGVAERFIHSGYPVQLVEVG